MSNEDFKYTNKDDVEIEYIRESEIGIPVIKISNIRIPPAISTNTYTRRNYKLKLSDNQIIPSAMSIEECRDFKLKLCESTRVP